MPEKAFRWTTFANASAHGPQDNLFTASHRGFGISRSFRCQGQSGGCRARWQRTDRPSFDSAELPTHRLALSKAVGRPQTGFPPIRNLLPAKARRKLREHFAILARSTW